MMAEKQEDKTPLKDTISERKKVSSIRVLYLTVVFTMLGLSIGVSSVWPYVQKMDSSLSPQFLGWINAGQGVGTLLGDVLFGKWMAVRSCKEPLMFSSVCLMVAGILYLYAQAMGSLGPIFVLISRSVYGLNRGSLALCRAGLAEATTSKKRTIVMANMVFFMSMGYSTGAALQMAVVKVGEGIVFEPLSIYLNLYTIPGLIAFLLGTVNLLATIFFFDHKGHLQEDNHPKKKLKLDYFVIASLLLIFFLIYFGAGGLETVITPLAMDEYALTKVQAVIYVGIILLVWGVLAMFYQHFVLKALGRRFSDRKLLVGGILLLVVSIFLYIPFGNKYPKLLKKGHTIQNVTNIGNNSTSSSTSDVGCSVKYSWCSTTPQLTLGQFIAASFIFPFGHSTAVGLLTSLYSKIRGPSAQGIFMSIFSASGDTARLVAPPIVARSYVSIGPRWTFLWLDFIYASCIILLIINYKRLIPYHKRFEMYKKETAELTENESLNKDIDRDQPGEILYVSAL